MKNGIFRVGFSSSLGASGAGLAVIKDGIVNGGDDGYLYTGTLKANGNQASARIAIQRYNAASASVFGPLDHFTLDLVGTHDPAGNFKVSGGMADHPGMRITIAGQFLAQAT